MITKTWPEIETAFVNLLSRISGLPKSAVASSVSTTKIPTGAIGARDGTITFPMTSQLTQCEFAIVSVVPLGTDEYRPRFDPAAVIPGDTSGPGGTPQTGGVIYDMVGNRTWTIEISIESWDQAKGTDYARAIHDRITLPSARAELAAVGLPIAVVGELNDASYEDEDGRPVVLWVFELTCNGSMQVTDEPVTTIETVETTFTVSGS